MQKYTILFKQGLFKTGPIQVMGENEVEAVLAASEWINWHTDQIVKPGNEFWVQTNKSESTFTHIGPIKFIKWTVYWKVYKVTIVSKFKGETFSLSPILSGEDKTVKYKWSIG